jgi:hypothetical protein
LKNETLEKAALTVVPYWIRFRSMRSPPASLPLAELEIDTSKSVGFSFIEI